jgi:hypothetical protein
MAQEWDGASKWEIAQDSFFGALQGVEDVTEVGAIIFPQPGACDVDPIESPTQFQFQSGWDFIDEWQTRENGSVPDGSTPLGLAFERANEALLSAQEAGRLEERQYRVVVVTDGEPNCSTSRERLLFLAGSWRDMGVEVNVMGLPGSAPAAQLLHDLANVGGTDDYVAPSDATETEDTLYVLIR